MNHTPERQLERLQAHHDIVALLNLYARGIDRCDIDLLREVFWEDARVDYGSGPEPALAWCEGVIGRIAVMDATMHALSNIQIEFAPDCSRGWGETYCHAYHALRQEGQPRRMIVGGRYLDRFDRRSGKWGIVARTYVIDWNETDPSTRMVGEGPFARFSHIGDRFPNDPLYPWLAEVNANSTVGRRDE